jgi:hypothetical protein
MNNTQRQLIVNMNGNFTKDKRYRRKNSKGKKRSPPKSGQTDLTPSWSRHDPTPEQKPEERSIRGKENSSTNDKLSKRKFTMKRKTKYQEADNNYQTAHYSDQINHSRSKREPDVFSWWIDFDTEEAQKMMEGITWENYRPASLPTEKTGDEMTVDEMTVDEILNLAFKGEGASSLLTTTTKTHQQILREWSEKAWENYLSSIKSSNGVCAWIGPKKNPWGSLYQPNGQTQLCVNKWPLLTAC